MCSPVRQQILCVQGLTIEQVFDYYRVMVDTPGTTSPVPHACCVCGVDDGFGCEEVSVAELVVSMSGPAWPNELELLSLVDPAGLADPSAQLAYLERGDRVIAYVKSLQARALTAVAGEAPTGGYLSEVAVEHEVAVARRTSTYAAGRVIENARLLATTFPGFAQALRDGEVSEAHVNVLVERTRNVHDRDVLAAIADRVLGKAKRMTPGQIGKQVAKAVADLDPDAEARHRRAKDDRRVFTRPLEDGMGFLGMVDDHATVTAIAATLDADATRLRAERGGSAAIAAGNDEARMDACRADALATRVLGTVTADGGGSEATVTFTREPVPVLLNVVMDLDTLRAEHDRMALLDEAPIPAGVARELAEGAVGWRRMVTDPVDGHLLDAGTTVYLPQALRRYVLPRDGGCRSPVCSVTSPRRIQLDHAEEFPDGPSSAGNTGGLCGTDHQLKTARLVDIENSQPDGSCTWITGLGQRVEIPPRPYLHDPRDGTGPPDLPPF